MIAVVLVIRTIVVGLSALVDEQTITPGFYNLVRWQAHRHVSRQSYTFFQNDFAGRIATKVWQAGQATGDLMESFIEVVWFMVVYTVTTLALVAGLGSQAGRAGGDLDRRLRLAGKTLSAGDPQACRGNRRSRLDDHRPHRRFLLQRADAETVLGRRRRPLHQERLRHLSRCAAPVHAPADRRAHGADDAVGHHDHGDRLFCRLSLGRGLDHRRRGRLHACRWCCGSTCCSAG